MTAVRFQTQAVRTRTFAGCAALFTRRVPLFSGGTIPALITGTTNRSRRHETSRHPADRRRAATAPADAAPIPHQFASTGQDRAAIETLLTIYTRAVSTKNQALFETLLLNKDIPFSGIPLPATPPHPDQPTQNYGQFRRGVFAGSPFTQRFQDVRIRQDGALADITLVFVNSSKAGSFWGWKSLQLLKVGGQWKIASEFYTAHG